MKKLLKQTLLIGASIALLGNAFALSPQDKAMQQELLVKYGLNSDYCGFYSDTKDATVDDMSKWHIICTAPDQTIISNYNYVAMNEPNDAVIWQSELIQSYGNPFEVKGRLGRYKMLWHKNSDQVTGIYFQALQHNGNLIALVGDYNKGLTARYQGTLLQWV